MEGLPAEKNLKTGGTCSHFKPIIKSPPKKITPRITLFASANHPWGDDRKPKNQYINITKAKVAKTGA